MSWAHTFWMWVNNINLFAFMKNLSEPSNNSCLNYYCLGNSLHLQFHLLWGHAYFLTSSMIFWHLFMCHIAMSKLYSIRMSSIFAEEAVSQKTRLSTSIIFNLHHFLTILVHLLTHTSNTLGLSFYVVLAQQFIPGYTLVPIYNWLFSIYFN